MNKPEIFRDGELYLVLRSGVYHIHGTIDGERIRTSCSTRNLHEARLKLVAFNRERKSGWRPEYDDANKDWREIALAVHRRHKTSAKQRGMLYDLAVADVYDMMKATNFCCAISGIPFAKTTIETGRDPWAPSLDRIENRHGYVLENVRVVTLAANIAMNAWGYDVVLRLARGVVRSASIVANEIERGCHAIDMQKTSPNEINGLIE